MSILVFPLNPSVNQEYTKGEITWRWDGARWKIQRGILLSQQGAIEAALNSVIADIEDALQFRGTIGSVSENGATVGTLPTEHGVGWTFKVVTSGTYAGKVAEIGDMIVSVVSRANTGNTDADWAVIQKNIDFSSFAYDIIPAQDEQISIGSPTKKFNELYLSGNTIYIGNKTISVTENGEIAFPAGTPIKLGHNTIGVDSNGDVVFGDTRSTEQSPINPGIKIGNKTISVDSDGAIAFPSGTPLKLGDNLIDIDDSGDFRFQAMHQGAPVARGFRIGNVRIGDDNGNFSVRNAITSAIVGVSSLGATRQNIYTANRTLDMDDAGTVVEINSSSNLTITIPADSTMNFPDGTEIAILRLGTGTLIISPAEGVTINSDANKRKIKTRYTGAALRKLSANNWILVGNLEA